MLLTEKVRKSSTEILTFIPYVVFLNKWSIRSKKSSLICTWCHTETIKPSLSEVENLYLRHPLISWTISANYSFMPQSENLEHLAFLRQLKVSPWYEHSTKRWQHQCAWAPPLPHSQCQENNWQNEILAKRNILWNGTLDFSSAQKTTMLPLLAIKQHGKRSDIA